MDCEKDWDPDSYLPTRQVQLYSGTGIFHILIGGIGVPGLSFIPLVARDLLSGIKKFSLIFILELLE